MRYDRPVILSLELEERLGSDSAPHAYYSLVSIDRKQRFPIRGRIYQVAAHVRSSCISIPSSAMSEMASTTSASRAAALDRDVRLRRSSVSHVAGSGIPCTSLPGSIDTLDLMHSSPMHALASLRFLVLSYLADLENSLTSPSLESWKLQGEHTLEEAKQRAQTALEMLEGIRADVCSHLPDPGLVKSRLRDMPDVPTLNEMRSHLPDIQQMRSHLPDMADMRAHLPDMPSLPDMDDVISDMRLKLDDVRSRFNEIDFHKPFNYIPTLSRHLQNLHSYLSSMEAPSSGFPTTSFAPNTVLSNLLESLLNSEIVKEILESAPEVIEEGEDVLERAVVEVADALTRSLRGVRLIKYGDLPHPWRSNPFVTHGYRSVYLFTLSSWSNLPIDLYP